MLMLERRRTKKKKKMKDEEGGGGGGRNLKPGRHKSAQWLQHARHLSRLLDLNPHQVEYTKCIIFCCEVKLPSAVQRSKVPNFPTMFSPLSDLVKQLIVRVKAFKT